MQLPDRLFLRALDEPVPVKHLLGQASQQGIFLGEETTTGMAAREGMFLLQRRGMAEPGTNYRQVVHWWRESRASAGQPEAREIYDETIRRVTHSVVKRMLQILQHLRQHQNLVCRLATDDQISEAVFLSDNAPSVFAAIEGDFTRNGRTHVTRKKLQRIFLDRIGLEKEEAT